VLAAAAAANALVMAEGNAPLPFGIMLGLPRGVSLPRRNLEIRRRLGEATSTTNSGGTSWKNDSRKSARTTATSGTRCWNLVMLTPTPNSTIIPAGHAARRHRSL
jgi:hypothetical protein